jgi:hypothetical protein
LRRALLEGFPYAVLFVAVADAVHVLAVAHVRREPGYWFNRIRRSP